MMGSFWNSFLRSSVFYLSGCSWQGKKEGMAYNTILLSMAARLTLQ